MNIKNLCSSTDTGKRETRWGPCAAQSAEGLTLGFVSGSETELSPCSTWSLLEILSPAPNPYTLFLKERNRGAWVAQWIKHLTLGFG